MQEFVSASDKRSKFFGNYFRLGVIVSDIRRNVLNFKCSTVSLILKTSCQDLFNSSVASWGGGNLLQTDFSPVALKPLGTVTKAFVTFPEINS